MNIINYKLLSQVLFKICSQSKSIEDSLLKLFLGKKIEASVINESLCDLLF